MTTRISLACLVTVALLVAAAPAARAEGRGFGIGAETDLVSPLGGAILLTYNPGAFHFDGLLQLVSQENTATFFGIGGRIYFPIHQGASSDFNVGGGLIIAHTDNDGAAPDSTDIALEGGAKIRAFITDNVCLHGTLGLAFLIADQGNDVFGLLGRLNGGLGLSYFFN